MNQCCSLCAAFRVFLNVVTSFILFQYHLKVNYEIPVPKCINYRIWIAIYFSWHLFTHAYIYKTINKTFIHIIHDIEDVTWPRGDTKFLFECWKIFHECAQRTSEIFSTRKYIYIYYINTVRAHFGQSNFSFFQQKRKNEMLLILIIFAYFKVQKKREKKIMVGKIDHFFHFSNFEVKFKNTKNTVNG